MYYLHFGAQWRDAKARFDVIWAFVLTLDKRVELLATAMSTISTIQQPGTTKNGDLNTHPLSETFIVTRDGLASPRLSSGCQLGIC